MKRLEAICDAVAHMNGYHDPESDLYELRNPGALKGPDGKRRYSCHRAGYASFVDLVRKHCIAHPNQDLASLLDSLGIKMKLQQENALDFMARCANSNALNLATNLHWFLEEENGRT